MLTIIIFTNGRYNYLVPLLNDIVQSKVNTNIKVVNYGKNNKKKIKPFLKRKNIEFTTDKINQTFAERFTYYIKKIKTKYAWFIGDDDRVETKYLKPLISFLESKNNSGFALNYSSFYKNERIKKNKEILENIKFKPLKLLENIHNLGALSTQIININYFNKISKFLNKKILLNYGYPQVYIALKLIKKFQDWKFIENKIIFYRYGNFQINSENLKVRLNMEFNGYYLPAKEIFGINSKIYKKIFKIIFFKNIFSWLILTIEKIGKNNTKIIISNYHKLIPNDYLVNCIIYLIFIMPINVWSFLKKSKNFYQKII